MAWLSGYNYRKSITLSRASGAVSNYQMKLLIGESSGATGENVDCEGLCLSTFNDLRFTKSDGTTLLDYWIESLSGSTPNQLATVWIEFDSIGTSATTFYMYYGNADAPAVSNGANTFIYFQDFNALNTAALNGQDSWSGSTNFDVQTTTKYEGTKAIVVSVGGASSNISRTISSITSFNMFIQAQMYTSDVAKQYSICCYIREGTNQISSLCFNSSKIQHLAAAPTAWEDVTAASSSTWYKIRMALDSASTHKIWINDSLQSLTHNSNYTNVATKVDSIQFEQYIDSAASGYFDQVFVGQYLDTEPAWGSWGAMEGWAGITTETATATDTFDGGSLSYATSESAEATATFDGDSLRDFTSESAEATDTFGNERTAYGLTTESAEATDTMGALHLVDATTESASASDSMEAEDLIRKKIKFPNLQGKHLSLKFESATDGSFAIYYLRHKMLKTRELCSDQKHPNTQGSHIGIKLSNSGSDEFILMYVSEKMQLVTT